MNARFALTQDLVLIGAGGHGRVLMAAIDLQGGWVVGVSDPKLAAGGTAPGGQPVLGEDELLQRCPPDKVMLVNGVGSTGAPRARHDVFARWRAQGYRFAAIVHPSAFIAAGAAVGEGVQVMAGAVVQNDARIGANSLVNTRAGVDHDCVLGETVHLAPGVTLSGGVTIGDRTHVGTGACVIQGVRIGSDVLIGAGAVIVGDVADGARVAPGAVAGERKESPR
ncbi:MAG: acetyltransferase [Alphaproteobacteria bacterium]|nr:acetyltransferase [Alphaproteobacteria bacterium]